MADDAVWRSVMRRNELLVEARRQGVELKVLGELLGVHPTTIAYRAPLKKEKKTECRNLKNSR